MDLYCPKDRVSIGANTSLSNTVILNNTGKTPARRVTEDFYIEIVPNGSEPHFEANVRHIAMSTGVMIPNTPEEIKITRRSANPPGDQLLTENEKTDLAAGSSWIATHGIVWYDDIFKIRHWAKFCSWADLKPGDYSSRSCTAYNDADDK